MIKLYNLNTDKIETYQNGATVEFNGANMYVDKLTEAQLNSIGLYYIQRVSPPNRRYYTYTETSGIQNGKYVIGYTATDRPLDEVKQAMLKDLSEVYKEKKIRPRVSTSLGFDVDGGYNDIVNFQTGKEFSLPEIKDADNIKHTITSADYDTIINEIKQNGINLFVIKDAKEQEILTLASVQDCKLYENTPYDYTVTQADVDADMEGILQVGQVIVKYRNNVKEW